MEYTILTDRTLLDMEFIHKYLSNESYWAKGRSLELIEKSIENSLCFGVFDTNGKQIAFARVVTDYVVFAWVMDVFVAKNYTGKGIGKALVGHIVNHKDLRAVNGIGLRTNDAHNLYKRFDFTEIPKPHTWMLRKNN